MITETTQVSPAMAAQLDWTTLGEFWPERFEGEARRQYEEAAARIERQFDSNPM